MASKSSFMATFNIVTLMLMVASSTVTARPLMKPSMGTSSPTTSLVYRLKLDEDTGYCWDSLIQLQHCSGELILFFLNGETYIGPGCCSAIRTIGRKCWPTMIGVLGFTAQEGDMLQGYCDGNDSDNNGEDHALASSTLPLSVNFKTTVVRSSASPSNP
ncbi:Prolamin-like domain [Arabidopsis suecica]|uniref:Prolamin-like domain n=1 Tax=Arabidopsis suecica TaxID=45249 RepID=A0A8T2HM45_ARASU|nr:Prolamin-like domain [Arabidopsis suecica]